MNTKKKTIKKDSNYFQLQIKLYIIREVVYLNMAIDEVKIYIFKVINYKRKAIPNLNDIYFKTKLTL